MKIENSQTEQLEFVPDSASGLPGAWFRGRFLYFDKPLKRSLIFLGQVCRQVDSFFESALWLAAVGGWLAFGYWIYKDIGALAADPISILIFWSTADPLVTFFLLSLWADLFLVYLRSRRRQEAKKIDRRRFSKKGSAAVRGKRYDVARALSLELSGCLDDAYLLAAKLQAGEVDVLHLFRAFLRNREAQTLFIRLNVDAKKLFELVDSQLAKVPSEKKERKVSAGLEKLLVRAFVEAFENGEESVGVLDALAFCADSDERLSAILYELEIDGAMMKNAVAWLRVNRRLLENYKNNRRLAILKPGSNMDRAYTAVATPTLDHFSRDLTVAAKYGHGELAIGRQKELAAIFEAFSGGHNGVLLVGPVGVGKSAIVSGLAQMMVEEDVPKFLKDKRLVELDVSRLVSGADASQAEERLLVCLNEIARSGNIILYIDNLENLVGISAGSRESLDLSEVLASVIDRRQLFCLAAATDQNYAHYLENRTIGNSFTTVGIGEPGEDEAINILEGKVGFLESKYDIYIVYSALEQAVRMSQRYLHERFLPLKAIDLLEKAAIIAARKHQNDPSKRFCDREDVAAAIGELTGIPVAKVTTDESQKLLTLENEIHKRLIGQNEAVAAVCASLRRARAQMKDSRRPIASFLFLGPTGVGKTELAKAVSEAYFGNEDYLIRLDMSEYQEADSVKKMIGDVDGTLGYLTEAVRKKPFSLILLDEIEKAEPDILNLFLQLLDDGRLTDGQGRTISFSESIIIATSNIGAVLIQDRLKAGVDMNIVKQELIDEELNKHMRPELINRFDGIIVFRPLSEDDVFQVATLMLKKIKKSLAEKGIGLKADKEGVMALAKAGYDPKFGARPLRRLLQDKVEDDIAQRLLSGELRRRDSILIDRQAAISVEKAEAL